MFGKSEWTFSFDGDKTGRVSVGVWMGFSEASVDVTVEMDGEMTTRRGRGTVERKFGPHFPEKNPVAKVTFRSVSGDVEVSDRSAKRAGEAYGSEVVKALVEQRRRTALLTGARELQSGELFAVELTREEVASLLVSFSGPAGDNALGRARTKLAKAYAPNCVPWIDAPTR